MAEKQVRAQNFVEGDTLPKLLKLGINCYLATWGYNTQAQQKEARRQGAVILNEKDFYKELTNF
ncbi:MAG: hypothetical protein QGH34_00490, partial [Candidatus Woesearchaeota archaeon]|jgi:hypothetical protein|nr:hypothetical protein [Candidatus Woesearchaeota archaeon]